MSETAAPPVGPYSLPPLKFGYADLEPVIDEATMRLHHDKHHQAYIDGVNAALAKHPEWLGQTIEAVLGRLAEVPEDIRDAVRNQGGGHANHQFFWKILTPNAPAGPSGELATAIDRDFGSIAEFKTQFQEAGAKHFGSGWAFLVVDPKHDFKLKIVTLPNQDSVIGLGLPDCWRATCGSTRIILNTTTAAPTGSFRGGASSTGTTSASGCKASAKAASNFDLRPVKRHDAWRFSIIATAHWSTPSH